MPSNPNVPKPCANACCATGEPSTRCSPIPTWTTLSLSNCRTASARTCAPTTIAVTASPRSAAQPSDQVRRERPQVVHPRLWAIDTRPTRAQMRGVSHTRDEPGARRYPRRGVCPAAGQPHDGRHRCAATALTQSTCCGATRTVSRVPKLGAWSMKGSLDMARSSPLSRRCSIALNNRPNALDAWTPSQTTVAAPKPVPWWAPWRRASA